MIEDDSSEFHNVSWDKFIFPYEKDGHLSESLLVVGGMPYEIYM